MNHKITQSDKDFQVEIARGFEKRKQELEVIHQPTIDLLRGLDDDYLSHVGITAINTAIELKLKKR